MALRCDGIVQPGQVVGTYFNTHRNNIIWCWSVIAAGAIPVILSPLSNDKETLIGQLGNIERTFDNPTVITTQELRRSFEASSRLNVKVIEKLVRKAFVATDATFLAPALTGGRNLAVLLLTSGSTGHSKAVEYSHVQLMASVRAKSAFHRTTANTNFMSWICECKIFATHVLLLTIVGSF